MGVLDSLVGGDVSAELVSVVNSFIQKQGGVKGLINQFEKQGLGPIIRSWAGKGENHPITAAQMYRALGFVTLQQLGAQLGLSPNEMAAKLSKVLPNAIEKATAEGKRIPTPTRTGWRYFTSSTTIFDALNVGGGALRPPQRPTQRLFAFVRPYAANPPNHKR